MFHRSIGLSGLLTLALCTHLESSADTGEQSKASVAKGLAACERMLARGEALASAVAAEEPNATPRPQGFNMPGYRTREPSWELPGMVYVAPEARGGCTVVAYGGDGPAIRDTVAAARLQGPGDWFRISVVAPQLGNERDALCTISKMPDGRAFGMTMTTAKGALEARKFIATSLVTPAEQCTSRRL